MSQDQLYVTKSHHLGYVPLLLSVPDNIEPITISGFSLKWSQAGINILGQIQVQIAPQKKNLPYASLRSLLETQLDSLISIDPAVGLKKNFRNRLEDAHKPFAYLDVCDCDQAKQKVKFLLDIWLLDHLKPLLKTENISEKFWEQLDEMRRQGKLLEFHLVDSQKILPWHWNNSTGTADGNFRSLVDYIARLIAGKEIFTGQGTMKRILSNNLSSGEAELMTDPIIIDKLKGLYSLVIKLEIITFPSHHQPFLKINVSKRRWLNRLDLPTYKENSITGYIFSNQYSERVFDYKLLYKWNKEKEHYWELDKDFNILAHKLNITQSEASETAITSEKLNNKNCQVVLTFRHGLNGSKKNTIDAGVPEIDKLEAFRKIADILKPIGFSPFQDCQKSKIFHSSHDSQSIKIDDNYLFNQVLKTDQVLVEYFQEKFPDLKLNLSSENLAQNQLIEIISQKNCDFLNQIYSQEKLLLYIFYEDGAKISATIAKAIAELFYGNRVEVKINTLPPDTHGYKEKLPFPNLKNKDRFEKRIDAWRSTAEQINKLEKRVFCLVIASEYYVDPQGKPKHDDKINKPSTRKALAELGGACVQFLLPIEVNNKKDNYLQRVRSSLLDLLLAHSGHIDKISSKVNTYLAKIEPEKRPKEIIGITIVRKQQGRVKGYIEMTFIALAIRINVESGNCELCFGYENRTGKLEITSWQGFADSLSSIAKTSPIKFGDKNTISDNFSDFVKNIVSPSVEEGKQPLVIIDSSNCVKLWDWLADKRLTPQNIYLGKEGTAKQGKKKYENMQEEWQEARIIRIRQEIAPGIIEDKERRLFKSCQEDTRTKKELEKITPDKIIHTPTNLSSALFKLENSHSQGCEVYLSIGEKTLHKHKRGWSCYHSIDTHQEAKLTNQAGSSLHQLTTRPPFTGQWPSPNPLEITVTLRQPEDNADDLANLVASLRYDFGHYREWSSLPAPLFFERVVRDYISDFAIDENEADNEED